MLGIIIQARLGSTRLPGKVTLPFYNGKGILELIIDNLSSNFKNTPIIIATTNSQKDDEIFKLANDKNIKCFRGSENNVLDRFIKAAEYFGLTEIIRVCSDNPFLNISSLKFLINNFNNSEYDYVSFKTSNNIPIIKTHYGLWAEGVKLNSIKKIITENKIYLEHVTNYIYEHPNDFKIKLFQIEKENDSIRLTTDTKEDFLLNKEIFSEIVKIDNMDIKDFIKYISNNNIWLKKMREQIKNNLK
ncbi:cytidylyltransferase domain-containing protein [Polaribacter tangerinus]|jgi:spore coat polysaccharide biosynthesis protein SpsF (cytidylyltransferase family)|uniref:cytidylyltransferase domain-containing protein n=1 Tax=Polaribacter tangerinus TaxID=1920034 RepID=UPI000B4BC8CA|nr:glycosyl transferase family 2 [Polaribacter tangerinus]